MTAMSETVPRRDEGGFALIIALFFAIVVLGLTISGTQYMRSHREATRTSFISHGQALQFSRSGLIEALGWFRKQTSQPVVTFDPRFDAVAVPPVLETIEPDIGIVREFEISGSLWGRYEVWKQWPGDPVPDRLAFRNQVQCVDISAERGNLSPGSVWRVRSVGYVFRRNDPGVAYDQQPNQVLGTEIVETEIRRLALQPPSQAALSTRTGSTCVVATRGRVLGGTAGVGIYYLQGTGSVTVSGSGATVSGTQSSVASSLYNDDMTTVFGVGLAELKSMADANVTLPAHFPSPVPTESLIVAETNMTFTSSNPLSGTGVVVVRGNVTINQGSNSSFSGLLYVDGNLVVREPAEIQGAVVATGSVRVEGSSDTATITFDDGILNRLRQNMGTYRLSSATTRPLAAEGN